MTQEEFTHIASEMRANAVTVALKCGAAPADAEDIAQDVMLKLWYLHEKMDDATRIVRPSGICRTGAMDERSDRRFAQHLTNRAHDETTGTP